jgi:L,D-transpeptidase catalytic domain
MGAHGSRALRRAAVTGALVLTAASLLAGVGAAQVPDLLAEGPAAPAVEGPASLLPVPVPGTPCTAAARACVDVDRQRAWLIEDGRVVRGPVAMTPGDEDDPTPRGTFTVEWKAAEYTSREYLVQMPYSVFFAAGGIAFHEGGQDTSSAGCVKLRHDDAVAFFGFLQVGDQVQVR